MIYGGGGGNYSLVESNLDNFIDSIESSVNKDFICIPNKEFISGISCVCSDLTNLKEIENESVESFSCLGIIGLLGLGQYGDPINPSAWEQSLLSMQRVLKSGGKLLIAVQIGKKDVLQFNSGRIFRLKTICDVLNYMRLIDLNFINNHELDVYNCLYVNDNKTMVNKQNMQYLLNQDSITALIEFEKI
ncbi:DUF268 domain-containing protein [Helicobacter saguini]|uniref:DUF268 domain-containing protein n=1 Tax=Helicobacter saguini TaxID=1548018 RepID=A0A4U8T639_9HELI|nr:DUF268 domain-containing protein [Helicobacter saguini]MWV62288.1 DUF268 domain-containing protein [Helicobacter saguini]MWV67039.1 DUF268 domain-containing protein [Helicobacter saguini]MWV69388.1 DUF268 domain-containing protein [Helicobacter saguini]TLD95040.1 DUF268 domain-containing protein [Helicobacter saguini]